MRLWLALLAACDRPPCEVVAWSDADGDGHGDPAEPQCRAGDGTASDALDCDDGDPAVGPGRAERCDGVDQDCDGWIDDHPDPPRFVDRDGDGFGGEPLPNCDAWGVDEGGDCDDADPFLNPGTVWYGDGDGDGAGADEVGTGCVPPEPDAVSTGGDCDDADPARSPFARERCGGGDEDCDPSTDDSSGAWMVPDAVGRQRATVRGAFDAPLVLALDAPDVTTESVRVVVQRCAAGVELPTAFLPDEPALWRAGAAAPVGVVVALWDEDADLTTVEDWPDTELEVAVYWGGAPGTPPASDLLAGDERLETGGTVLELDPARGATVSAIRDPVGILAGQAQATAGNGLRTPQGPLQVTAFAGESARLDQHPVTAAVSTTVQATDGTNTFTTTARWRMFAGRAAALGRLTTTADSEVRIEGTTDRTEPIRPLQLRAGFPASCATDPGLLWGDLSDGDRGLTWAWVSPPRWTNFVGCGTEETWTSANDLPGGAPGSGTNGSVPYGQVIVDGGVVVLLPHGPGGPGGAAARRAAWVEGPLVTVFPAEE
jgi:hypothetical protein